MSLKKVTLVGASGNVGAAVLPELLKSDLDLTILSREGSSAIFPPGAKVVKTDYSEDSLVKILAGQDAVVSMLPIMALGEQQKIVEAAIKAGVKRFIPSEYGSDSAGLKFGMTGFNLAAKTATLVDGGKTRFTASNTAQIGRAIVAVLKHSDETKNQLVFTESFTTTQLEVLASLEKITGEKWKTVEISSQAIREDGFAKLGKGEIMEGGAAVIMALVLGEGGLEDHTHVKGGIWNDRLGLKTESVDETVKAVLSL
ncbi:hypothetical protein COL516b_009800 [Colletotrichum fioriniae]|nr:uncharacterized protein COL516b_009800 [Colletotrichum fioriniae]KAJ0298715.1 hypothetical protein COL516b_009800 [Colletotrichum fioriniae]